MNACGVAVAVGIIPLLRVQGLGFEVLGLRVKGLEFRVKVQNEG